MSKIRLSTPETARALKVGDVVTTDYIEADRHVRRVITAVHPDEQCSSGVRVYASDGGLCECCQRPLSKTIDGVDGLWFLPVNGKKEVE